jgi:hypothetical protein
MTYYSRRQLEALGEPLGDSVTRKEGGRIIYGGGGGGGQAPQQNTTYNTNVPEYARPYVENMLESTQKQIYTDNMAGFRPYRPYSTTADDYFASYSPMQKAAQSETANLQTPEEMGIAGAGSLLAGSQYNQNVTDPARMQSFMSPYQQGVTDIAKTAAVREAQMAQNAQNLGAARQGTYGGARQALMQGEREKNLLSNLSNIQTQGSQSAFDRAVQSQQFGANLGLQGYGQAAQIGSQRQAADLARINAQNTMGASMQAQEQNKINQQIQDYAIAQQYPFMQLGMMNAMLRGLPMQTQSTQLYQAQPSMLQQGIGLAGAAGTFFGGRNREGGTIKEYREGGITESYAPGGRVNPESEAVNNVQMQLASMDVNELREVAAKNPSEQIRQMASELLAQKEIAAAQTQKARMSGIAAAGGGLFDTMGMAGGGILAFAPGGDIEDPEELANQINLIGSQLDAINKEASGMSAPGSRQKAFKKDSIAEYENVQKRQGELKNEYANLMSKAGLDKPAFNYQPSRSLGAGATANPVEQVLSGNKPTKTSAMPTEGEFKAFDEATKRFEEERASKKPEAKPPAAKPEGGAPIDRGIAALTGRKSLEQEMAEQERLMGPNTGNEGLNAKIAERLAKLGKQESQDERAAMRKAFIEFGTNASPGGIGVAALKGLGSYGDASEAARKAREGMDLELTKMQADIKKGERAERRGNLDAAAKAFESAENRQLRLAEMQNQLKVAGIQASRSSDFERQYAQYAADEKAAGRNPTFEGFKKVSSLQDDTAKATGNREAAKAFAAQEFTNFNNDKKYIELKKAAQDGDAAAIKAFNDYRMQKFNAIRNMIIDPEKAIGGGSAGSSANLVQNKDGSFNYVPRT